MLLSFHFPTIIDRMVARNNSVDVITQVRLIANPGQLGATTFDLGTLGTNAAGLIKSFTPTPFSSLRWEANAFTGGSNLGCTELRFLKTPEASVIAAATVSNSATQFNTDYAAAYAINNDVGSGPGHEYASAGLGLNTFVEFDFGSQRTITAFDFFDRLSPADRTADFDLIFSNSANFSSPTTLSFSPSSAWGFSQTFAMSVTARYVRYDVTAKTAISGVTQNQGISEIIFYAAAPTLDVVSSGSGQINWGATQFTGANITPTNWALQDNLRIFGTGVPIDLGNAARVTTGSLTIGSGFTLQNGSLIIGNGGTTGLLNAASLALASPAISTSLRFNRSDTFLMNTQLTGTGRLVMQGTGTMIYGGTSTLSDSSGISAAVFAGRLELGTPVINSGTTGSISGNFSLPGASDVQAGQLRLQPSTPTAILGSHNIAAGARLTLDTGT